MNRKSVANHSLNLGLIGLAMGIKQTELKVKKFFASSSTRKWIGEPDELRLQDIVKRRAKKALGNPFIIIVSAISDLEPTIKREIIHQSEDMSFDPEHSAFELFQLMLQRHKKGVLCVSDLESIDADCLVFLGRLVDYMRATKSKWKVVFSGEAEHMTEACLQRLGICHKKGTHLATERSVSEWSDTLVSIFNNRVL